MCGRFAVDLPPDLMARLFGTRNAVPNLAANWNTAPTQGALVVRRHPETGQRNLDVLTWGLLPNWTKDAKQAKRPINARSETVAKLPTFRDAFKRRRAIVPITAFFEWKRDQPVKQPYAIARADGSPLALAGLWEGHRGADGEVVRTFCILTTTSNRIMQEVHDRMPVILEAPDWPAWLGETDDDPARLLQPAAENILRLWPVSTAVNAVRNNGADLLAPLAAEEAPPPSAAPPGPNPA